MSETTSDEVGFAGALADIKREIRTTQAKTIRQVNKNLIMMYFKIGKILFENSLGNNHFIKTVATELKVEYPKLSGFSEENLRRMRRFYDEYREDEKKWSQLVTEISWGHNVLLLSKIKDKQIRELYIRATIENGWSRNVLDWQIGSSYHRRVGSSVNNFNEVLPASKIGLVNGLIKDPYIFGFLTLKDKYAERELESKMTERIRDVLIELGSGWSFVGNQYKLTVGNEDYYVDLLFYHLKLKCYIVVELKATKFMPEYVGKMNFYLSAVDDLVKNKNDNPSIGLILCKERNGFTANYSLKDINKPIGVSSFETDAKIVKQALKELPTETELNLYLKMEDENE